MWKLLYISAVRLSSHNDMNKTSHTLLFGILLLFLFVRIPGIHASYYQDEFKNVVASETSLAAASEFFTHPPLTALLLRTDAVIFGGSAMRVLPLLFGILSVLLLFIVVRRRVDERSALWSAALYAVSFYGVWSSLMVDTDGAILPTLFLASVYAYDRLRESQDRKLFWSGLLVLVLVTGLMVKLSFILVIVALLGDVLIEHRQLIRLRHFKIISAGFVGISVFLAIVFFGISFINPFFQFGGMIAHARAYMHFADRNYLQVLVQAVKAVYYLSPLLLAPLVFLSRDLLEKARVFVVYLALGFIFYFILFDFSRGALDKYLMFSIIPLCVLSGVVFSRFLKKPFLLYQAGIVVGVLSAALVIGAAFVPQAVVPLYPKSAWFLSVLHGHLNVLTPFNGGSGPLGFYVSFLVIFLGYLLSFFVVSIGFFIPRWRQGALIAVLFVGLSYNALFIEEFSFGKIHGSAPTTLAAALSFIEHSDASKKIITYNDIGAYELSKMGKYAGRFYAVPQFEAGHKKLFSAYDGQFLVVGIPPLYEGFYSRYFAKCDTLFETHSGVITSTVYTCKKAKK